MMRNAIATTHKVCRPHPKRRPRVPVLVVLGGDGAVEIYGQGLAVQFVHRLTVQGQDAERLADQYLDATLPHRLRPLYVPTHLAGQDICRPRSVAGEVERLFRLELVRELVTLARGPATVPAAIQRARRAKS
jgi:hypothetical protein